MFTSDEVVARLSGMRALDCDYFVGLDVRDFFLSGAHSDLVDVCLSDIAAGPQKEVVSDVLWFLLWHQYVQSKALPGRRWRPVRGSGMGLPHSSHLSDWALLCLVEKDLLPRIADFGIKFFARYRDDILIVTDSRLKFWHCFAATKLVVDFSTLRLKELLRRRSTSLILQFESRMAYSM